MSVAEVAGAYCPQDAKEAHLAWCIVFAMPEHEEGQVMSGMDEDKQFSPNKVPIPHEAWSMVEKLVACELIVDYELSFDGQRLMILVRHHISQRRTVRLLAT